MQVTGYAGYFTEVGGWLKDDCWRLETSRALSFFESAIYNFGGLFHFDCDCVLAY